MNLSDCHMGQIVRESHVTSDHRIGHIVGLTANPTGHVIPLVRFATAKTDQGVHHANLERAWDRSETAP